MTIIFQCVLLLLSLFLPQRLLRRQEYSSLVP